MTSAKKLGNQTVVFLQKDIGAAAGDLSSAKVLPLTAAQIAKVEERLADWLKIKQPQLFKKYPTYYRQYLGLEFGDGHKIIHANFFCRDEGKTWLTGWKLVRDGGDCYFNFSFDVNKMEIVELTVNGEA